MLCSIIIPLYNKENFVNSAIQSILDQSYQNFEIIIVDDGSTDNSAMRVKAIRDPRIKFFQQTNGGVSRARNRGIDLAIGDLVIFLDADDWFLPTFLEKIVSMAEQYPDISYFATSFKNIYNPDPTILTWDSGETDSVEIIDNFFDRWQSQSDVLFITGSVAIRRLELVKLQPCFPLGEQSAEDQDLWFKLGEKYTLAYSPAKLASYRKEVEGSLCATESSDTLLPAFTRLEQRALSRQMPDPLRQSALRLVAEAKITLARKALMKNQRYDAVLLLLNTWRGVTSKRWWVTMLFCLIGTPTLTAQWEKWRHQRTQDW